MVTRDRRAERGRQRGRHQRLEVGRSYRLARRAAGLSQSAVGRQVGISQSMISRIERGIAAVDIVILATVADVVGLKLVVNLYEGPAPLRDAGHVRILARLKAALPSSFEWATERIMPIVGDRRSIDAVVLRPRLNTGFELESRLTDAQALVRRTLLKQRDAGLARMVIVLPDTLANRQAVAAAAPTLTAAFPLTGRRVMTALRVGRTPDANGIIFI